MSLGSSSLRAITAGRKLVEFAHQVYHPLTMESSTRWGSRRVAREPDSGRRVELRQIDLTRSQVDRTRLGERLLEFQQRPIWGTESVLAFAFRDDMLDVVVPHETTLSWETWLRTDPGFLVTTRWLLGCCECLEAVHERMWWLGFWDDMTLHVVDQRPCLNVLGSWVQNADWGAEGASYQPGVWRLSEQRDRAGLAQVVATALQLPDFVETCQSVAARATAQLKQWIRLDPDPLEPQRMHQIETLRRCLETIELQFQLARSTSDDLDITVAWTASGCQREEAEADDWEMDESTWVRDRESAWGDAFETHLPAELGPYRIFRSLNAGGMGTVFEAEDRRNQQRVALKLLREPTRTQNRERLWLEAEMLSHVQHHNVVRLVDCGEIGSRPFLALEFVAGTNLKEWLLDLDRIEEASSLAIALGLAQALAATHEAGLVHRDLKPDNILIDGDLTGPLGTSELIERLRLIDFGIAGPICRVPQPGDSVSLLGTPRYMAPECFEMDGRSLPQTDVYAFGITLYELLAGRPPFQAEHPVALAGQHCLEAVPSLTTACPEIGLETIRIVERCLAKDPRERFAHGAELLEALEALPCLLR